MSANGNLCAQPKECPVCQEPFDTGFHQPELLDECGHSVCSICIPGRILWPGQAACPLCWQDTPIPPNGLPINNALL
ncbi:hypothetical protein AAVH_26391, partial [Aphelenchoides avenae]